MAHLVLYPALGETAYDEGGNPVPSQGIGPVAITPYYELQMARGLLVVDDPLASELPPVAPGNPAWRGVLEFTAVQEFDYTASYGEHVLLGQHDPMPNVYLPPASVQANGQVGVTLVGAGQSQIVAIGEEPNVDTICGAGQVAIYQNHSRIFQSDGVSTWWIVAAYEAT